MKLQSFAKVTILFQSIWHLAWAITLGRSQALQNLVRIRWAVETPRGGNIYGYCDFFVFVFLFFNRATAHTREPIVAHNCSKTLSGVRKTLLGMRNVLFWNLGVFYPKNTPKIGWNRQLPAKNKMSNNSETARDTRNMLMNHDLETWVALSDFVNKTCVKRPLAEKSRWRHFRLAIIPRYLGNHASQIKSYYGTLSGSHDRFFRIRHENLPKAPLNWEITMTSYLACNETSLSRKPYILDKMFVWNAIRKSWSLFKNPSWKITWSAP